MATTEEIAASCVTATNHDEDTDIVFLSGKYMYSSYYERNLIDAIKAKCSYTSDSCWYAGEKDRGEWLPYVPKDSERLVIPKHSQDTYTFSADISSAQITLCEVLKPVDCSAKVVIGASQGGIIATEYALQQAESGRSITLILLSSSPTLHQLERLRLATNVKFIATVGWNERFFGGVATYLDKEHDWYAVPHSIMRRIEAVGGSMVMFNGKHCEERWNTFNSVLALMWGSYLVYPWLARIALDRGGTNILTLFQEHQHNLF